jgi:hypothetical protein
VFFGALAASGRMVARSLVVACVLLFAGWLSWGAVAYWAGHLESVIGGFFNAGANVGANVNQPFQRASPGRTYVLYTRGAMTLALLSIVAFGVWVRRRAGARDYTALLGALTPFPVVLVQDYGGEALLRAYLFSLPFLALLAALGLTSITRSTFFRAREEKPARRHPSVLVAALVMSGVVSMIAIVGSVTIRYGNEKFEQVRPADLHAVQWVYDHARPDDTLIALTPNLPWRYRDINRYDYEQPNEPPTTAKAVLAIAEHASPGRDAYLIVTPGEEAYGQVWYQYGDDWIRRLTAQLRDSPGVRAVYRREGATVYRFVRPRA